MTWLFVVALILGLLMFIRALFWGGPWLVVWRTSLGNDLMWPCWTRAGATYKAEETARLWGGQVRVERRGWVRAR